MEIKSAQASAFIHIIWFPAAERAFGSRTGTGIPLYHIRYMVYRYSSAASSSNQSITQNGNSMHARITYVSVFNINIMRAAVAAALSLSAAVHAYCTLKNIFLPEPLVLNLAAIK